MITTAIVLPVRYYPLSALLPPFLPAVEKKKKKKTKEREKEREKERWGEGGEKWVGTKSGWWVKIGNDELSGRSIFQTTDETLGREGWRRGLWNGIRHSIRSRRKKFYYHGSVTSRFTRLPVQRLELSQNRGKHREHSASNKAGNVRIFRKGK